MKDNNGNKKPNIFKRIAKWCGLTWVSFTTEVEDRIFMSWKRLIKFAGISLIPIIYGVICVVAFWNPIDGIGRAPMAIMDQDNSVLLVKDFEETDNGKYIYNVGSIMAVDGETGDKAAEALGLEKDEYSISEAGAITINSKAVDSQVKRNKVQTKVQKNITNGMELTLTTADGDANNEVVTFDNTDTSFSLEVISTWDLIKASFLPKDDENILDTKYKFESPEIKKGLALTNISYINDHETIDKELHGTNYYAQIRIPEGYTEKIIKYMGELLASNSEENVDIDSIVSSIEPMEIWTTFERNFIFGYYLNTINDVADGLVLKALPDAINGAIYKESTNSFKVNGVKFKELLGINGESTDSIDEAKDYVISDTANLAKKDELKNYTLFGDVNGTHTTAKGVGGKFINSILNLEKLVNTDSLSNIIGQITGGKLGKAFDFIKEVINGLLHGNNAIVENDDANTYDVANNLVLIGLNKAAYNVAHGQNIADPKIVKTIKDILSGLGLELPETTQFNKVSLFEPGKSYIEYDDFSDNFSKLMIANPDYFFGATSLDNLLPTLLEKITETPLHGLTKDDVVKVTIQGQEYGQYGMGLGQFFLVIGLYIGCLLQTFIFDRAKRLSKAKWSNWYMSKWMLMASIATVQVTLQVWIAYAVGWHQIGGVPMVYVWLWLWFVDIIFVTIVQGLWFIIKDEAIGRFLAVIVMVFSLTAGGGTFPAFTQFGFFTAIGKVVPFTYALNGFGEITYGVSLLGTQDYTTIYIFKQFGIMLIYFVIFFGAGFFIGGRNRMKDMDYGSHYGFAVAHAMRELGRDVSQFQIVKKTHKNGKTRYKYNWKALKDGFDPELYFKCRELHKFEGEFKWWARKPHDFVQKPNYSDEDTITRNE